MYHGAEHKVINCVENGYELTVENARKQTKEHKRCGTSFLLYVVVISFIVFLFIQYGCSDGFVCCFVLYLYLL